MTFYEQILSFLLKILNKMAKARDVVTGEVLLTLGHDAPVWMANFSPDGTKISTASEDGTAKVWNAVNGQELSTLRHGDWVYSANFSP